MKELEALSFMSTSVTLIRLLVSAQYSWKFTRSGRKENVEPLDFIDSISSLSYHVCILRK